MQAQKLKNKKYRKLLLKLELDNIINTVLIKNKLLSPHYKYAFLPTDTSDSSTKDPIIGISRIRNICNITGRSRALIKDYRLSRIKFKELAEAGQIPGVKKY